ncbi:MAG TPA: serine protease, partial [Blastocatellia bacterium]|nr:serine protease [Blastocatellia bacterium]
MKNPYLVLFFLVIVVASPFGLPYVSARQSNNATAREIALQTLPSVVILAIDEGSQDSIKYGSGFFISPDIVATNFHVVDGALGGFARIVGKTEKYEVLGFTGLDPDNDLALVKLKGTSGKPLTVGDSSAVVIGDSIFAAGNPEGLEGTFSQGIVSGIRDVEKQHLIQITAPISHGSSGGPVLDSAGRVIGVAVGAYDEGHDLNFAIPASALQSLIKHQQPLISITSALKDFAGKLAKSEAAAATAPYPKAATSKSSHAAPSLNTDEVYESKDPSLRGAMTGLHIETEGSNGAPGMLAKRVKSVVDFDKGSCTIQAGDRNGDGLPDSVTIVFTGPKGRWSLEFSTWGLHQNLSVGAYDDCVQVANSEGSAGLTISGGSYCNERTDSSFTILAVESTVSRRQVEIVSFAAKFETSCGATTQKGLVLYDAIPEESWGYRGMNREPGMQLGYTPGLSAKAQS